MIQELKTVSDTTARPSSKSVWQKTPYPNLIRYVPSGTYFGRRKVGGKLIRRSLETHVLEVAKLRVSDFLKDHRRFSANKAGASAMRAGFWVLESIMCSSPLLPF